MARDKRYAITFDTWHQLLTAVAANAGDLAKLQDYRERLAALLGEGNDLTVRQANLIAAKQEVSKRLQQVLEDGRKLATFLRGGVTVEYGNRNEKLAEFRIQPLRRRTKAKPATPATDSTVVSSTDPPK